MKTIFIKNGSVYDGTGSPPEMLDVLVGGGRILEVGAGLQAHMPDVVIDANGLAVTPGFVDIHRHCDKHPFEENAPEYGIAILRQGITTTVVGNCGISMVPLSQSGIVREEMQNYYMPVLGDVRGYESLDTYGKYLEKLRQSRLPVNFAAMAGMGAVRIAVKGFAEGEFTAAELLICRDMVKEIMRAGAPGISIGLMYLPECYESAVQLGEILKPVGEYGGLVTAHIRGEGDSLLKSIREILDIGKRAQCRIEISHLKSCGVMNWNRDIFSAIELIEAARRNGQEITCDFYPYDCGSTTLMSMVPPIFIGDSMLSAWERLRTDEGKEELRQSLAVTYENWDNYAVSLGWDKVVISSVCKEEHNWLMGKNITQAAEEAGAMDEVEIVAELLSGEQGRTGIIIQSMQQSDIDAIAKLPYSCVISDAVYAETDRPHPRMYGAFPRMIADYVGRRRVLTLTEAIAKMTSIPAGRMGMKNRGEIKAGNYADINVFDPAVFCDKATYSEPKQYASGLTACILNGEIVVMNDKVLSDSQGRVLTL